jgi:hypothetical protein
MPTQPLTGPYSAGTDFWTCADWDVYAHLNEYYNPLKSIPPMILTFCITKEESELLFHHNMFTFMFKSSRVTLCGTLNVMA